MRSNSILKRILTATAALFFFGATEAGAGDGFVGVLEIDEPGFDAKLRIRVFYDPEFFNIAASAGHLVLVYADSASGEDAFFIPTDLAFELGDSQVYRVEFEQVSDLFGQALGGRLRPGETQLGFMVLPSQLEIESFVSRDPGSVVVRYAHHRAPLRTAPPEESAWWSQAFEKPLLGAGLNRWWEWVQTIDNAPGMDEGEQRLLAERVFPGQGHVLAEEGMSAVGLRNAILRVGEKRLLETRATQQVLPHYPAAALQAGVGGLVVALCYITPQGEVADAVVLASNTAHLLNLSALVATMDWRFSRVQSEDGTFLDGWKLLHSHFRAVVPVADADDKPGRAGYQPPTVIRRAEPDYPFDAKRLKIKGTVVYRVTVDEEGRLVRAVLEQSVHPLVDQAALGAVERTRYLPATQDGEPVRGEIVLSYSFEEELD
jgi:protein TonB